MFVEDVGAVLSGRFSCLYNLPPVQVQVLSAALKAAQLDSPTDNSPPDLQLDVQPESDSGSLSPECKSEELQSEIEGALTEEEQTMETVPASETCPLQEQGDEPQTETLENKEESPPCSPVMVGDYCNLCLFLTFSDIYAAGIIFRMTMSPFVFISSPCVCVGFLWALQHPPTIQKHLSLVV